MKMKSLLWMAFAFFLISAEIAAFGFDAFPEVLDILPNLAGHIILFVCFSILSFHERGFLRARTLTVPLILLQLVFLWDMVDNANMVLILQVLGLLGNLLLGFFAFAALGRLAATFEQDNLRRPVDGAYIFFAISVALPLISRLMPDLTKLCFFVSLCLCLYVLNLMIRCYRQILLPVEAPDDELSEVDVPEGAEGAEPGLLPDAVDNLERVAKGWLVQDPDAPDAGESPEVLP